MKALKSRLLYNIKQTLKYIERQTNKYKNRFNLLTNNLILPPDSGDKLSKSMAQWFMFLYESGSQ